jgi:sensor histidine kinase YesM
MFAMGPKEFMIIPFIFLFVIVAIAMSGFILVSIIKALRGNSGGKKKETNMEEARLMQEIYRGLRKMEERVESLETIIMDKKRKEKDHDTYQ